MQVICSFSFWIQVVPFHCIKSEHISQHLQIVFVANIIERLILGIRYDPCFMIPADKIGIDQTDIATEETLGSLTSLVHRMIENIINKRTDIFLPQPCAIKQDAIDLLRSCSNLMLLVLQN